MIIAIDGPSGAGKSTLGKMIAKELGLLYLDTGAMYRAVALAALRNGIPLENTDGIVSIAERSEISLAGGPDTQEVFLNGENVTESIRGAKVGQTASIVSTNSGVRKHLVDLQRQLGNGEKSGAVLDGRDIGTVVFPNADIKFYLTATPEARARRRFEEDHAKGREVSYESTVEEINRRDLRDTTREDSPLRVAEGAIVIDTSEMSLGEALTAMLERIPRPA